MRRKSILSVAALAVLMIAVVSLTACKSSGMAVTSRGQILKLNIEHPSDLPEQGVDNLDVTVSNMGVNNMQDILLEVELPPQLIVLDQTNDRGVDVILDIDLPVVVRFGHTELPIRALTRLGPGSVIDLGRSPDDPVEVLVSNRVVAHGEVVIVGGNYGVRILDVASQSERARSMEA